MLQMYLRWEIHSVQYACIWDDRWVPDISCFRPQSARVSSLTRVCDFLNASTGIWDTNKVLQIFFDVEAQNIFHSGCVYGCDE